MIIIYYRFAGDVAELGIIRAGKPMKVQAVLNPRVHLVCHYHIDMYLLIECIYVISKFSFPDAN